jgi:hypothetical protein
MNVQEIFDHNRSLIYSGDGGFMCAFGNESIGGNAGDGKCAVNFYHDVNGRIAYFGNMPEKEDIGRYDRGELFCSTYILDVNADKVSEIVFAHNLSSDSYLARILLQDFAAEVNGGCSKGIKRRIHPVPLNERW